MSVKAALTFNEPHKVAPYAAALRQAGIEAVPISADNPQSLEGLDGLLLTGGTDLNPALYGAPPEPDNEEPDDARDELETRLLAEALAADLPVLAICRGMQLFNVAHGGTLIQNLANSPAHVVRTPDPALPAHAVVVEPRTRLADILGAGPHAVNSRHHQAVERVGAGLRIAARSVPDGIIEAVERADRRFAVAVQWHPEDQVRQESEQLKLFQAFAGAMSEPEPTVRGDGSVHSKPNRQK